MGIPGVRPRMASPTFEFDLENAPFKGDSHDPRSKPKSFTEYLKQVRIHCSSYTCSGSSSTTGSSSSRTRSSISSSSSNSTIRISSSISSTSSSSSATSISSNSDTISSSSDTTSISSSTNSISSSNRSMATHLWLALAALAIFLFFCISSSFLSSSSRQPPVAAAPTGMSPAARSSSSGDFAAEDIAAAAAAGAAAGSGMKAHHKPHHPHATAAAAAAQYKEQLQKHARMMQEHVEEKEEEETTDEHEDETEEETDDEHEFEEGGDSHLQEPHPEYSLGHEGLFDESKQHPDEPEYIDIWDGVTGEDLHLSAGVPGLKTPLIRLPFLEGQHNDSHVIGVYAKQVEMPRFLKVSGGRRIPQASGVYRMLMIPDGRPKPHLNHGRLIWRQAPLICFCTTITCITPDPARSSGDSLQPLLLQKIYKAPEDGTFSEGSEFDEDFALFEEEHEEELEEEDDGEPEVPLDAHGEPVHLPLGAKTFQQFLTHLRTSVYHTFDSLHPRYDHDKILEDPVAFVEANPHPDLVGPEGLDGYAHDPTPHPLRSPPSANDEH
ncbi:hypothetical protein ACSSS7_006584 [Eimeria intestinalis]